MRDIEESKEQFAAVRQESHSQVSYMTSSCTDEEYDTFDGDAVHLGEVDVVALLASESTVQGQNRRVTSQRLIGSTRT